MKKTIVVIISLLISFSVSFASPFVPDNTTRLFVGTGNDKFSMGISENDDDFLTFDFDVEYSGKKHNILVSLEAYTNRAERIRYDSISVFSLRRFNLNIFNSLFIQLEPAIDFSYSGDLNLDKIQNLNHRLKGIEELHFDYKKLSVSVVPSFSAKVLFRFGQKYSVWANAAVLYNHKLKSMVNFGFRYGILSFEGVWKDSWFVNICLDTGVFRFQFEKSLIDNSGYGALCIDMLSLLRHPSWEKTDLMLSIGKQYIQSFEFLSNTVSVPVNDKFAVFVNSKYTSGFPKSDEIKIDIERIMRNHVQLEAGFTYTPVKWFVTPYTGLGFGYAKWETEKIETQSREKTRIDNINSFYADLKVGTYLIPEGFVRFDCCSLMLNAEFQALFFPSAEKITQSVILDKYHSDDYVFKPISISFFVGVVLGIDN